MTINTAARTASAPRPYTCPPWCVIEHGDSTPEDVFHRSAFAWLAPNDERSGHPGRWELKAHIVSPEAPEDDLDVPLMVVETQDGVGGHYVELDVEQVEEFIRQGKAFLAHVQQLGEQLATASEKGKQS
ncbi:hypothetical protein ABZX30_28825 [Streptomyces sp. NPDC004542]|uniref:DUF6907 domain-containing protein n=1 Tax=Streptomyces sp. NPDC004542 TaxID=3154281 RepID=UPI0033AC4326